MAGWTKLFSSIVTSSVWCEDDHTLRVWIAMLAMADSEGLVEGSVPGLANLCRVTPEQMRHSLDRLSSPDPDSRTKAHEGRRIEAFDGGWKILNYLQFRDRGQAKDGSRAPYMRAYRTRNATLLGGVTRNTEERRERLEAEEETNNNNESSSAVDETTRLYCMALDAVFHRRTTVRGDDITAKIKQRLKTCSREMIVSTPILVAAQKAWTLPTKPLPIHFLRDGEHPKVRDGQTYGAKNWIARSCESIDGTVLDSRLAEIARQAGVLEWLLERGAVLAEEAIA